ncbi:MAG: phospholipase D-like domain-containing protein [Bacteroidales bacterium]|nr:phospholipase D-like domain-containing protein [Bacteroidales bacterium]
MKRSLLILLAFVALAISAFSQDNIADARTYAVGATVTVTGVVTNGLELGVIRYIQDETAGIGIYDGDVSYFQRGDLVTVTGKVESYNQLLEIGTLTAHSVTSSGNPLPVPELIVIDDFGEDLEGELVRVNQVQFVNAGGTFSGNTNYNITAGGETGVIRINTASNLVGQLIPTAEVDLVGVMSQFHYSNPNEGYQLLLRNTDDIILGEQIAMASSLEVMGLTTAGFSLYWKTNLAGTSQMLYGNTTAFELGVLTGPGPADTNHTVTLGGATPSTLFYVKAFSVKGSDTAFSGVRAVVTTSVSTGDMKVYFTSTVDNSVSTGTNAIQLDNAVDDTVINYINRTKQTLDIAIYNFGMDGISNIASAVNNAYNRGVQIRIVVDGSTANQGIESLNASIRKIASPAGVDWGIMHNKFVVMDAYSGDPNDPIVWTGSTNWTSGNVNTDANNVVVIQDKSLAIAYTLEFNEMWGTSGPDPNLTNSRFGFNKIDDTPHEFIIDGKSVYCYFSPTDGVNQQIIETIQTSNSDIEVNTMLITRSDIGYALRDEKIAGIDTRVIVNKQADCSETVAGTLISALGSNFKEYGESGLLHSKSMIVDQSNTNSDPQVLLGSHNWSASANDKNDENTLIIHDATIANLFYQEFMARWALGVPLAVDETDQVIPSLVYPNPSAGQVMVQLNEKVQGPVNLRIYNRIGQLVFQADERATPGSQIKLNISDMDTGIYFLEVTGNNMRISEKLVIIR